MIDLLFQQDMLPPNSLAGIAVIELPPSPEVLLNAQSLLVDAGVPEAVVETMPWAELSSMAFSVMLAEAQAAVSTPVSLPAQPLPQLMKPLLVEQPLPQAKQPLPVVESMLLEQNELALTVSSPSSREDLPDESLALSNSPLRQDPLPNRQVLHSFESASEPVAPVPEQLSSVSVVPPSFELYVGTPQNGRTSGTSAIAQSAPPADAVLSNGAALRSTLDSIAPTVSPIQNLLVESRETLLAVPLRPAEPAEVLPKLVEVSLEPAEVSPESAPPSNPPARSISVSPRLPTNPLMETISLADFGPVGRPVQVVRTLVPSAHEQQADEHEQVAVPVVNSPVMRVAPDGNRNQLDRALKFTPVLAIPRSVEFRPGQEAIDWLQDSQAFSQRLRSSVGGAQSPSLVVSEWVQSQPQFAPLPMASAAWGEVPLASVVPPTIRQSPVIQSSVLNSRADSLQSIVNDALKTIEMRLPGRVELSVLLKDGQRLELVVQAQAQRMEIDISASSAQMVSELWVEGAEGLTKTLDTLGYQLQTLRVNGETVQAPGSQTGAGLDLTQQQRNGEREQETMRPTSRSHEQEEERTNALMPELAEANTSPRTDGGVSVYV